jgi:hypothetical protein
MLHLKASGGESTIVIPAHLIENRVILALFSQSTELNSTRWLKLEIFINVVKAQSIGNMWKVFKSKAALKQQLRFFVAGSTRLGEAFDKLFQFLKINVICQTWLRLIKKIV